MLLEIVWVAHFNSNWLDNIFVKSLRRPYGITE
jgi:hypothetical protein